MTKQKAIQLKKKRRIAVSVGFVSLLLATVLLILPTYFQSQGFLGSGLLAVTVIALILHILYTRLLSYPI